MYEYLCLHCNIVAFCGNMCARLLSLVTERQACAGTSVKASHTCTWGYDHRSILITKLVLQVSYMYRFAIV